jgi:hypothetical protein
MCTIYIKRAKTECGGERCSPNNAQLLTIFVCCSVGIATKLQARRSKIEIRVQAKARHFLFSNTQTDSGSHLASNSVSTAVSFTGKRWPENEADHSPVYGTEDRNAWSHISISPHVFIAQCLIKNIGNTSLPRQQERTSAIYTMHLRF